MAEGDRPALALPPDFPPERKVATLLHTRFSLAPPVDVRSLVGRYADVEFDQFPTSCDCLLLRKLGERPRLIVSQRLLGNQNRLRFTLAHELGHLVLPWQAGSVFCHADFVVSASDELSRAMEAEANRFAAELLLPRSWLTANAIPPSALARHTLEVAQIAGVSPVTAMFAIASTAAPGALLLVTDASGKVTYSASSPGSNINVPDRDSLVTQSDLENSGGEIDAVTYGDGKLMAVRFAATILQPSDGVEPIASTDILQQLMDRINLVGRERSTIMAIVNGVVGSANNLVGRQKDRDAGSILKLLKQRFVGRPELSAVMKDPLFAQFLRSKAIELSGRRS